MQVLACHSHGKPKGCAVSYLLAQAMVDGGYMYKVDLDTPHGKRGGVYPSRPGGRHGFPYGTYTGKGKIAKSEYTDGQKFKFNKRRIKNGQRPNFSKPIIAKAS